MSKKDSASSFIDENFKLKILVLDIETAPLMGYMWDVWQQNIQPAQIISEWFCFTWAAKWLFEKKVYSGRLTGKEALKQNDKRIMGGVWELLNEADVVIAHNGDKFDIPRLNTRFIIHRINPPTPYQSIDTLKTVRKQFAFSHNKLDFVNQMLSLPRKQKHEGFDMWNKCFKGDEKSLKEMEKYNIQDVRILEEFYLRLRPWIKPHPNLGLFILDEKEFRCPSCGSKELTLEGKLYYTTVNAYEQFRCKCGAVGRKRTAAIDIKQRRHILSSSPK
jgi:DNA polymerase elongation subunit (family B)